MWPHSRHERASLAAHLVIDSGSNVLELVETLARGWQMSVSNGMVRTADGVVFEAAIAGEPVAQALPPETTALALHLMWISFTPAVLAAFIQSKHMSAPSGFWATLHSWTAWILAAPEPITASLQVGRPDLQALVGSLYTEWLCLCRSPSVIAAQLAAVLGTCWEYTTHSPEWEALQTWIIRAGIMCVRPSLKQPPSIALNGAPCLSLSVRDRVLLALVQLFCTPFEWCRSKPPDTAPAAFRSLHQSLTANAVYPSPFDELYPRGAYDTRVFESQ
jgi:hypothetical protein